MMKSFTVFKAKNFSDNVFLKKINHLFQPSKDTATDISTDTTSFDQETLQLLTWFNNHILRETKKSTLQRVFGLIGILIGGISCAVCFIYGFDFGKVAAEKLNLLPHLTKLLSYYFGVTALIPIALLSARTSYLVFQALMPSGSMAEKKISKSSNAYSQLLLNAIVFFISFLASMPYLYLTHKTLSSSMQLWVYCIDLLSLIATILVNSWALNYVIKIFYVLSKDLKLKLKNQPKVNVSDYMSDIKFELRTQLLNATKIIELMRRSDIKTLYHKIYSIDDRPRILKFMKDNKSNRIHYVTLESINYLFNPNRIFEKSSMQISINNRNLRKVFGVLGVMIGIISTYQYLGNGKAAAVWLHLSNQIGLVIGLTSFICNAALSGLTAGIVFEEFYLWLYKIKLILLRSFNIKTQTPHIPKFSELFSSLNFGSVIYNNMLLIVKIIVALVAMSAATPNVYLTLQQSSTASINLLTYGLLICAFLGPFTLNFYAINKIIEQNSKRQSLHNILLKFSDVIEDIDEIYVKKIHELTTKRHVELTAMTNKSLPKQPPSSAGGCLVKNYPRH